MKGCARTTAVGGTRPPHFRQPCTVFTPLVSSERCTNANFVAERSLRFSIYSYRPARLQGVACAPSASLELRRLLRRRSVAAPRVLRASVRSPRRRRRHLRPSHSAHQPTRRGEHAVGNHESRSVAAAVAARASGGRYLALYQHAAVAVVASTMSGPGRQLQGPGRPGCWGGKGEGCISAWKKTTFAYETKVGEGGVEWQWGKGTAS